MEPYLYTLSTEKRCEVMDGIAAGLAAHAAVLFGYVHGSFLESEKFHDVDVAVYLDPSQAGAQSTTTALTLSQRLTADLKLPVDIRILNTAPLAFRYHAFRGKLIMSRDNACLSELLEETMHRYFDMAPLLRLTTKEAFAA